METGCSWLSIRLLCAAGIYKAISGQQDLSVWLGTAPSTPKNEWITWTEQPASVLKDLLTKKVQDSCLAQGWPQVMPKQLAYKNKSLKQTHGYTLHIGDSIQDSL